MAGGKRLKMALNETDRRRREKPRVGRPASIACRADGRRNRLPLAAPIAIFRVRPNAHDDKLILPLSRQRGRHPPALAPARAGVVAAFRAPEAAGAARRTAGEVCWLTHIGKWAAQDSNLRPLRCENR